MTDRPVELRVNETVESRGDVNLSLGDHQSDDDGQDDGVRDQLSERDGSDDSPL